MDDCSVVETGSYSYQSPAQGDCIRPTNAFDRFEESEIEQSIPDRFEKQVQKHSHRLAVASKGHRLTYHELNRAANRIAHAILERCGEGQEPISILFAHDVPEIAALLGILKSGKIYVPLDPVYPRARLSYILEDSQTRLVVTDSEHLLIARELAQEKLQILNTDELPDNLPTGDPELSISPENLAYIIYTSGSTGQPKGVIIDHRDVLHFIMIFTNSFHTYVTDRLSLLSSCSFSGSAVDIFCALLNGASLLPFDVRRDGLASLADWLVREEITIYNSVPTLFRHLADSLTGNEQFPKLRLICLGGDRMYKTDVELYKKHFSQNCILRNGIGSSEVKIFGLYFMNKETQIPGNIVPVGYPVEDTKVMILDDDGQETGFNHVGEIAVKTRYMSPGYWRRPDLTRARFLPDPDGGDERIYLTGDLGFMLPDRCLFHVGRKDFQVKIRGHRIEMAEIEAELLSLDAINEAVVVAGEDKQGDPRLVAYVSPAGRSAPTVSSLRSALSEKLPDYMLPSVFVIIDALPLNANGKVDREALPEPGTARPELDTPFVAARTPVEKSLAEIWAQVLDVDEVGVNDNFLELGGHSLLATQIISRVVEAFRVKIPLTTLFQSPTVADMAVAIDQNKTKRVQREDIDRMLAELEAISDEEARRLFNNGDGRT